MPKKNWNEVDPASLRTFQLEGTDEFIHVIQNGTDEFLVIHAGPNSKEAGKGLKLTRERLKSTYEIDVE